MTELVDLLIFCVWFDFSLGRFRQNVTELVDLLIVCGLISVWVASDCDRVG